MQRLLALLFLFMGMASILIAPCYAADNNINWTEDEIAFINDHPVARIGVDPQFSLYSKPYYHFKRVIVTKVTDTVISGIVNIEELTVAVQRNSLSRSYLLSYPKINMSLYESVESGLITAVANGTEELS